MLALVIVGTPSSHREIPTMAKIHNGFMRMLEGAAEERGVAGIIASPVSNLNEFNLAFLTPDSRLLESVTQRHLKVLRPTSIRTCYYHLFGQGIAASDKL